MHRSIVYEHPLNEKVRSMLRLEHLFKQVSHFLHGQSPWDSRVVVTTLMEILDVFGRGDLKTELMKEMERATANLQPLLENPGVDHQRLNSVLKALERLRKNLHGHAGQLGQELRDDEFLAAIRQRTSIPGGTCDFDLPGYHRWLAQSAEERHEDLTRWFGVLDPIRQPIELLLKLIRNSAEPRQRTAERGVLLQSLDSAAPYQLVRVWLPAEVPCYAEVSGGKHRFTVRFMQRIDGKSVQTQDDVDFQLSCCSL